MMFNTIKFDFSISGFELVLLGLPKTATTWLSQIWAAENIFDVHDESYKIEHLWSYDLSAPCLMAESVTDPLFLSSIKHRESAIECVSSVIRAKRYLLVLREPIDWLISLYRQYIKRGGTRLFQDFVGKNIENVIHPAFCNYSKLIDELKQNIKSPLAIGSYAKLKNDPLMFLQNLNSCFANIRYAFPKSVDKVSPDNLLSRANVGMRGWAARCMRNVNHVRRSKWNSRGLFSWKRLEKIPWHYIANFGKDIVRPGDIFWLQYKIQDYNDWNDWQNKLDKEPVFIINNTKNFT